MINYIKNDFRRVREAWGYLVGKEIPVGMFIPYYIVVGILTLPITLLMWIYYKIKIKRLMKEWEA